MSGANPNILMIMVDQLAAPALPCYGNSVAKTPNIDTLAEEGVVFENAYCNSPLCAPSRFSMLTGQLPSRIGAYDNSANFPADIPTMAHYLRAAGYQTCLSGKMHFVGPDQLHGFEQRLTTDIYPSDFGWVPDWDDFHTRPSWYHNMLSVVQAGTCTTSNQLDYDEEVAFRAIRKLNNLARSDDSRPFFLTVSFTHPHDPFAITPEYWNRYSRDEIDMPAVPEIPLPDQDPHSRRLHHVCAMDQYRQSPDRVRNARHAYYGMISYIDDKVGQLMRGLEAAGFKDDTVVVFISDHGEMLGERGMWYKMSFFEWSARVPMLFHFPKAYAPGRISGSVSLVDLLPTLVNIAGGDPGRDLAAPVDGLSLLPAIQGDPAKSPDAVYGELLSEGVVAPLLMIRRGRFKYVYSQPDPEQLYDLAADPLELSNLAEDPACQQLREAFRQEMVQKWDAAALRKEVIASQQRRRLVQSSLMTGEHTAWDFQPFVDASRQYMRNHLDLNELERTARYPSPQVPKPD